MAEPDRRLDTARKKMEMISYRFFVKDLGKESRKGLTDGLREFIKVDNERSPGCWSATPRHGNIFNVRKPKAPEGGSDVTVSESPDELTLRADEENTSKALINVDHIDSERLGLAWLMLTGMPSARRCTKASKEQIGKKCMCLTKK